MKKYIKFCCFVLSIVFLLILKGIPIAVQADFEIDLEDSSMKIFTMKKGKSYEIINTTDEKMKLENFSGAYRGVRLYGSKEIDDYIINSKDDEYITPQRSVIIEPSYDEDVSFFISEKYYDKIKEIDKPLLYCYKLQGGKTFEISNTSKNECVIYYDTIVGNYDDFHIYDFIRYKNSLIDIQVIGGEEVYRLQYLEHKERVSPGQKEKIYLEEGKESYIYVLYEFKNMIKESDEIPFVEYVLERGKSYKITNNIQNILTIYGDMYDKVDQYASLDIITYLNDGSIDDMRGRIIGESLRWYRVNPGGTGRLASYGVEKLHVKVPIEFKGCIEETYMDPLYKFSVDEVSSYEITNDTNKDMLLKSEQYHYDYILYKNNGDVEEVHNCVQSNQTLKPGEKIVLGTHDGKKDIIYIPYEYKDKVKRRNFPMYYRVNIAKNEGFEITNDSNKSYIILKDINYCLGGFAYIAYNNRGEIVDEAAYKYSDVNIGKNQKYRLNLFDLNAGSFYIPYEYKDQVKMSSNPAFYVATYTAEKGCEIFNESNARYEVIGSGSLCYIGYDSEGQICQQCNEIKKVSVEAGFKYRISPEWNGGVSHLYIPYEYKNHVKESVPAYYKIQSISDKGYEVSNDSSCSFKVLTDNERRRKPGSGVTTWMDEPAYCYIRYNEEGEIVDQGFETSEDLLIEAGDRCRISGNGQSSRRPNSMLYIPYEYKDKVNESIPPYYLLDIEKDGKGYKFINDSNSDISIFSDCTQVSFGYFLYSVYDKDQNVQDIGSCSLGFKLKAGFTCKVSSASGNVTGIYIPYEFKDKIMEVGSACRGVYSSGRESFQIINNSNEDYIINLSSSCDYIYDKTAKYVCYEYNAKGENVDSLHGRTGYIKIRAHERYYIFIENKYGMYLYIPSELKGEIKKVDSIFKYAYLEKGMKLKVKNGGNSRVSILNDPYNPIDKEFFKSIYCNEDGEVRKEIFNSSFLTLDANQEKILTLEDGGQGIVFYIPDMKNLSYELSEIEVEDISEDGVIDLEDLSLEAVNYNKTSNDKGWKKRYDINSDNIIDIYDLVKISSKL